MRLLWLVEFDRMAPQIVDPKATPRVTRGGNFAVVVPKASLLLDCKALDHGAPPHQLTAHETVELRQRHRGRLEPEGLEFFSRGCRARNDFDHRGIPALDDRPRSL